LAAFLLGIAYWHLRQEVAAAVNWQLRHADNAAFILMMIFCVWLMRQVQRFID
jgi:hypothetical protein